MKEKLKRTAVVLRKRGYSLKEIARKLKLAQSTASLWLRGVKLGKKAQKRLERHTRIGVLKGVKIQHDKSVLVANKIRQLAKKDFQGIIWSKTQRKLACALLYWCEGSKDKGFISFMNSDPAMMGVFVNLLRSGFDLDESKFRLLVHLHEYHDDEKQKRFWSKITRIKLKQFNKSYLKPHTGKNKKEGYLGCAALKYYDYKVALELNDICKFISKKFGRVA